MQISQLKEPFQQVLGISFASICNNWCNLVSSPYAENPFHSKQSTDAGCSAPNVVKAASSTVKVIATVESEFQAEYFWSILGNQSRNIRKDLGYREILYSVAMHAPQKKRYDLEYTPYSPYLVPSDIHLFPNKRKERLESISRQTKQDIILRTFRQIRTKFWWI